MEYRYLSVRIKPGLSEERTDVKAIDTYDEAITVANNEGANVLRKDGLPHYFVAPAEHERDLLKHGGFELAKG